MSSSSEDRSLLSRSSSLSQAQLPTALQSQVDSLVGGFAQQATDWRSLAAMMAGGMTYRLGRVGAMATGTGRLASLGIGLGAEVTAFEMTNRSLSSLTGENHLNPNLWRWDGQGGIRQGLLSSLVTFGTLKGAGRLAQGENVVVQHLLQDTGMVLGHQVSASFGVTDRPQGTLAEQFLHAEATNLQMGAGMTLAHSVAPGIQGLERGLDLSLRTTDVGAQSPRPGEETSLLQNGLQPAFSTAGNAGSPSSSSTGGEDVRGPTNLHMSTSGSGRGDFPSRPPVSGTAPRPRFSSIPPPSSPRTLTGIFNSEAPLLPFPVEQPVSPPRSVQEGIDRARVLGQGPRALEYLRWGTQESQHLPETQRQFLNLMLRFFEFQQRMSRSNDSERRTALDEVLSQIPETDFKVQNERTLHFTRTLESLVPGSPELARAVLFRDVMKGFRTRADFEGMLGVVLDQRMREAGVEPDTIPSIARNAASTLTQGELLAILDRPLLQELPETEVLRRAVIDHHAQGNGNLTQAFESFLADPTRAHMLHVEISRWVLYTRGLQELSEEQLSSWVEGNRGKLSSEANEAWRSLKRAARDLDLLENRSIASQLFERALAAVRVIPPDPYLVKGRYESAYFRFLNGLNLSQKESLLNHAADSLQLSPDAISEARLLQAMLLEGDRRFASSLRESHRPLEPANNKVQRDIDDAYFGRGNEPGFLEADLRLQLLQVREQLERVIQKVGPSAFLRRPYFQEFLKKTNGEPVQAGAVQNTAVFLNELTGPAEKSLKGMGGVIRRRVPSITLNLALIQRGLEPVSQLRRLARAAVAAERLPDPSFTVISPFMAPVAEKYDANGWDGLDETILSSLPHLKNTFTLARQAIQGHKKGVSPHLLDRLFLQHAAFLTHGTDSRYVVNPDVDGLVERDPVVADASHSSWQGDFLDGTIPGVVAAQLKGRHTAKAAVRILAKADLGEKMRNSLILGTLAPAIELLTEPVGSTPEEYDRAVTEAARAMALGHIPGNRPGPRSAGVFSELCMPVFSMFNPFVFDPFPPSTGMMVPPKGGRGFVIADRAMALIGRPPNMLLANALGGYILDPPKPNRLYPRRTVALRTVTELMPVWALIDPETNPDSKSLDATSHANWLRTYWWRQAITPEYAPRVKSIEERFDPFVKPLDIASERTLETMFGGALGVYPSFEAAESARKRVGELETQLSSLGPRGNREQVLTLTEQLKNAQRARDIYETRLLEVRLQRARLELNEARQAGVDARDMLELSRSLDRKEKRLEKIAHKLAMGKGLSDRENLLWQALKTGVGENPVDPHANQITEGLNQLVEDVGAAAGLPMREEILTLLNQRLGQARLAFVRQTLGEKISPAEEVLIDNLRGALIPDPDASPFQDRLVATLREGFSEISSADILNLVAEEQTRELTRQLTQRLPGSGRGALDSMEEIDLPVSPSANERSSSGSSNVSSPLDLAARVASRGLRLGLGQSLFDLVAGAQKGPQLYDRSTSGIARSAMAPTRWRPILSAETIRTIEEARIRSQRENRPLVILSSPLSGMERAALMTILPEARNALLETVAPLNPALSHAVPLQVTLRWRESTRSPRRVEIQAKLLNPQEVL
jgi:hypothetical protein